jgi:Rrf2 family protein
MLSVKAKYGLRALTVLARQFGQGPVLIASLAATEQIPHKFLELILLDLKRNGILESKKGKGGGYQLRKPPSEVSLGELIRVLDGPIALLPCVSQSAYQRCEDCIDEATCGLHHVMKDVRDATATILDGTTLADVLARSQKARESNRTMYHI